MYDYNAHSVMELRDFARSAAITYANVRKPALVVALQAWDVDHAPQVAAQLSPIARQARRANAGAAKTSKVAIQPSSPTNLQRKRKQPASAADSDQTSKRQKTIEPTSNDATGWVPSLASQVIEHEENLDLIRVSGGQIHKSPFTTEVEQVELPHIDEKLDDATNELLNKTYGHKLKFRRGGNSKGCTYKRAGNKVPIPTITPSGRVFTGVAKLKLKPKLTIKLSAATSPRHQPVIDTEDEDFDNEKDGLHGEKHGGEQSTSSKLETTRNRPVRAASRKGREPPEARSKSADIADSRSEAMNQACSAPSDDENKTSSGARTDPKFARATPSTSHAKPRTSNSATLQAVALTKKIGKTKMTAKEQGADFQRRLHEERRPGEYSDSAVANAWRVKYHTVTVKFDNDVRPDVERALMDQLGTERYVERYMEQAKVEGREVPLWMGGSSPGREDNLDKSEQYTEDWCSSHPN